MATLTSQQIITRAKLRMPKALIEGSDDWFIAMEKAILCIASTEYEGWNVIGDMYQYQMEVIAAHNALGILI